MNRRQVLASAAAGSALGLTGCYGTILDGSPVATVDSIEIEVYETLEENPLEKTAGLEHIPLSDYDLSIDASIETETATEETPARVALTVENEADEPRSVRFNAVSTGDVTPEFIMYPTGQPPGVYTGSGDAGPAIYLVPPASDVEREDDECWSRDPSHIALTGDIEELTFEPETPRHEEVEVWNDVANDDCLPAGEYIFPQMYILSENGEDQRGLFWGISLELTQ